MSAWHILHSLPAERLSAAPIDVAIHANTDRHNRRVKRSHAECLFVLSTYPEIIGYESRAANLDCSVNTIANFTLLTRFSRIRNYEAALRLQSVSTRRGVAMDPN
jgi:hypothetical protein